ncbi:MAG: AbrB/MazE/SpoVT family DNA-binding domain-containing protein [Betaproteobacteria bacterium]
MHATLTSKGQLTLPKRARDALKLKAGQRLAVEVSRDGTLLLTPQRVDPLSICNVLPKPRGSAGVRELDRGIARHVASMHRRGAGTASKAGAKG